MYINRLTIGLKGFDKKNKDEIILFNKISSYFEELLFYNLPYRVNIGGYGFFHVCLYPGPIAINQIKAYGQIIDFHFREIIFDLDAFCKSTNQEKINFVLVIYEKAIDKASEFCDLDKEYFIKAFTEIRSNDALKIEQTLGISRTHKSRKLRVDVVRELEPFKEQLLCRIFDKNNTLVHEVVIDPKSTIYDLNYRYPKSKWESNKYIILHSNGTINFEIDVTEFLS